MKTVPGLAPWWTERRRLSRRTAAGCAGSRSTEDGAERLAEEIGASPRFLWGRRIALAALVLAALGGLYLVLRIRGGEDVGLRWLWPAGCLLVVAITAAACFGIYARLPSEAGTPANGSVSRGRRTATARGHTMPGFVKANPIFCGFWLVLLNAFPIAILGQEEIVRDAYRVPLGIVVGTSAWWFWMLCFSRGWVKEGD